MAPHFPPFCGLPIFRKRAATAAAAAALLLASASAGRAAFTTISADSPLVVHHGRFTAPGDGTVHRDWFGSTQLSFTGGTQLLATFRGSSGRSSYRVSTSVLDQGSYFPAAVALVPAGASQNTTFVAAVSDGSTTHVVVNLNVPGQYYSTQAGEEAVAVSFSTDGAFVAPQPFSRSILALGDSITAATNIHAHSPCADEGFQSDYAASWSQRLCEDFNAACSTIAVGGRGLIQPSGPGVTTIPQFFRQTFQNTDASVLPYNFTGTPPPDVVLIHAGTNDYSKHSGDAFDALFAAAMVSFAQNVSAAYSLPPSKPSFFFALGPMTLAPANAIAQGMALAKAAGITTHLLNFTGLLQDGCATHPGVIGHKQMADAAAPVIAAAMGW